MTLSIYFEYALLCEALLRAMGCNNDYRSKRLKKYQSMIVYRPLTIVISKMLYQSFGYSIGIIRLNK